VFLHEITQREPLHYTVKKKLPSFAAKTVPQNVLCRGSTGGEMLEQPVKQGIAGSSVIPENGLKVKMEYSALRYWHYSNIFKKK
jgi:hypothetical protein